MKNDYDKTKAAKGNKSNAEEMLHTDDKVGGISVKSTSFSDMFRHLQCLLTFTGSLMHGCCYQQLNIYDYLG